jgi:uncharacterized protein YcfJ
MHVYSTRRAGVFCVGLACLAAGCQSPFYADRGAGLGALAGAGAGALVGDAVGDAGTGALVGAGLGALTGGVVGSAMDDMQARNRAEIAAQLGRQVQPGAATIDEVIQLSRAGVDPRLIQNYIRSSGVSRQLTANDVIYLHQNQVPTEVIQAMQDPPAPTSVPMVAQQGPPIVVEEHYYDYGPPMWHPHPRMHPAFHRPRGRVSWGVSLAR